MKIILCYGDSNTWGNIAGSRNKELMLAKRFDRNIRWTGVLQKILGENFYVIEAGLNGRTTSFDETKVVRPSRNGLATLPVILEMHYPLDLVIIMLGTNDARIDQDYHGTPEQSAQAIKKMVRFIKQSHLGQNFTSPEILVIAPPPVEKIDSTDFNLFFDDHSIAKTNALSLHYAKLAEEEHCAFLNAGEIVTRGAVDGIHFDENNHRVLANAIAFKIKTIFKR